MGNYTIKGLAKINECETFDAEGLANLWQYWLICNCCDKQCVNDFYLLRKSERQTMFDYLFGEERFSDLLKHILKNMR